MSTSAPQILKPLVGGPADQVAAAKERGTKAFRGKDFAGAVKAYTEALAITPDDHTLLSNRSAAYGANQQFKEAHADAKDCVRLKSDWPKGYARLGFALVHLFRLEEAQQAYQNGLKHASDKDVIKTLQSGLDDVVKKLAQEAAAEQEADKKEKADKNNRRRGLNHKPAWQSRGIGINEEMGLGGTGDLMKPGMTKADLERIENSLQDPNASDPFGDVFREKEGKKAGGKLGKVIGLMNSISAAPGAPPLSKAAALQTQKARLEAKFAIAAAPWRLSSLSLGASRKAKGAPPRLPPWRAKSSSAAKQADDDPDYDPFSEEPVKETVPVKAAGPLMTARLPVKAPPPRGKGALKVKAPPERGMSKAAVQWDRHAASAATGATQKAFAKRPQGAFAKTGGMHQKGGKALGKGMPGDTLRGPPPRKGKGKGKEKNGKGKVVPPPPMTAEQTEILRQQMKEKMLRSLNKEEAFEGKRRKRASAAANEAESWLKRGGPSKADQRERAAEMAEQYFVRSRTHILDVDSDTEEGPAAKKAKVAEAFNFAPEVLEKAPDNVQTLRSLLQFLEKKLQAELPAAPDVGGPQELKTRLEAHADRAGRLAALRATSGWDARAKRVLDISGTAKTPAGGKALEGAEKSLETAKAELEKQLKEKGEAGLTLDSCMEKRTDWAKDCLKRDWLTWCSRLCQARETLLMKAKDGEAPKLSVVAGQGPALSAITILERLLTSEAKAPAPVK